MTSEMEPVMETESVVLTPHQEFSVLASLLSLFATVNTRGAPVLLDRDSGIYRGAFEKSFPEYRTALNALAAQVVREHEIVAVGAPFERTKLTPHNRKLQPVKLPSDNQEPATTMEVFAVQDSKEDIQEFSYPPTFDFTAVGNSRPQDKLYSTEELESTHLKCIPIGDSLWLNLKAREWKYIWELLEEQQQNRYALPDLSVHIATLESYLKDYRNVPKSENQNKVQTDLFTVFANYSIFTTWPKMHRRMAHGRSQEILSHITRLSLAVFTEKLPAYLSGPEGARLPRETRNRDYALCQFFETLENYRVECSALAFIFKNPSLLALHMDPAVFELPNLKRVFFDRVHNPNTITYTKDTVLEFHVLLLAVLLSQRDMLASLFTHRVAIRQQKMQGRIPQNLLRKRYQLLSVLTILLWRISHSSIIRKHFHFMASIGCFLTMNSTLIQYNLASDKEENENDIDSTSTDSDKEDDLILCVVCQPTTNQPVDSALACQRWLRHIISNVSSLDVLSRFVNRNQDTNFSIRLLAARPPPTGQKVPWKSVLLRAIKGSSLNKESALSVVNYIIKDMRDDYGMGKMLRTFPYDADKTKNELGDKVVLTGSVHCEAVLASVSCLSKLSTEVAFGQDQSLTDIKISEIGVSRLCCPVCWELLKIIGHKSSAPPENSMEPGFGVRGCHSTLFTVQLPSWLSKTHVNSLFNHFKVILCTELDKIIKLWESQLKPSKFTPKHRSQTSEVLSETGSSATYSSDGQTGGISVRKLITDDDQSDDDDENWNLAAA